MKSPMPKHEYLATLQARNEENRQIVETVFVPLDQAQRALAAHRQWTEAAAA